MGRSDDAGNYLANLPRTAQNSVGYLLRQTCKSYRVGFRSVLEEHGLHVGQDIMLLELLKNDGLSQTELVGRVFLEASTVTRMLGRLEKAGFTERRRDTEDARVLRVYLTEAGRALADPLERSWQAMEDRALEGLTEEERSGLRGVLERIHANLAAG